MTEKGYFRLLFALTATLWAVAAFLYFPFTADDAFITARHAVNLVDGGELVFNLGSPVQALSSPLHGLLEALLDRLFGDPILAYKFVAAALVLFAATILLRTLARTDESWAMAAIVLASPCVVLWTFGGLETPLLLFLATLLAVHSLKDAPWTRRRVLAMSVIAGFAFLVRYDSVLFSVPVLLHAAWRARNLRWTGLGALVGAIAPAAWLLTAQRYYGDIFPTSYYVKLPSYTGLAILKNVLYMGQYLLLTGVAPFALVVFLRERRVRQGGGVPAPWLAVFGGVGCGIAAQLLYGLGIATHHMMFSFRFFVPYLPACAAILAVLLNRAEISGDARRRFAFLVAGLVLFQSFQVFYTDRRSINGLVQNVASLKFVEYKDVGVREYVRGLLWALRANAADIERHWANQPAARGRPARISTYAGGVVSYECEDAYIYEILASYRHNCTSIVAAGVRMIGKTARVHGRVPRRRNFDLRESADYIQILTPRHGTIQAHLPKPANRYELISDHEILFEGKMERFLVFYDPSPSVHELPRTLPGVF